MKWGGEYSNVDIPSTGQQSQEEYWRVQRAMNRKFANDGHGSLFAVESAEKPSKPYCMYCHAYGNHDTDGHR